MILKEIIKYTNGNYLEATFVDENDIQVYCRAYAGEQMDELVADLNPEDALFYADLIQECRDAVVPPPPPVIVIPQAVTPFQAKAALELAGLLTSVEAAIALAPKLAQLAWENATEFRRNSPTVLMLAQQLELTDEQLDSLFLTASGITA